MKFKSWEEVAHYCEDTFGVYVDWEERFFDCPECGEPLYECDWTDYPFNTCYVCEVVFEEI